MNDSKPVLSTGFDLSAELHEKAQSVFPGGVSHNVRAIEPYPIYIDRARDGRIWDVDGNEYVDFWMNHFSSILGHSHPSVVEAVQTQAENGLHWGTVNQKALELGRRVQEFVPSAERVRFCASGTEATMYAARLARAFTECDHILKVEGGWHGGNTDLSVGINAPYNEPDTVGLPPGAAEHVHAFPLNDREAVEQLLNAHEIAAVIVEPMLLAGGGIPAELSFLQFLREVADEDDFLLIFDEVVTAFLFAPGSYQARIGITPDLTTLGKNLGGGLPVGALCGRAELFEACRPDYQGERPVIAGGGTFSMNPMTVSAGLATLDVFESEPVHDSIESQGEQVRDRLESTFADLNIDVTITGKGSLFHTHFNPNCQLNSASDVKDETDRELLRTFHKRLFEHGYYIQPGSIGTVSYETTEDQLDGFIEATEVVAGQLQDDGLV